MDAQDNLKARGATNERAKPSITTPIESGRQTASKGKALKRTCIPGDVDEVQRFQSSTESQLQAAEEEAPVRVNDSDTRRAPRQYTSNVKADRRHCRAGGFLPKFNPPVPYRPDDYEARYPEDEHGEEVGLDARVWRVYLDECGPADITMIDGWRDSIDVLLVFAGLFSAVVTTFVVQSSTMLQQDFTQVTASLVAELIAVQRAVGTGQSVSLVPPSSLNAFSSFNPGTLIKAVNGFWFTSLAMSLSVALLSVLIKQWLHQYLLPSSGRPRDRALIRQFRYDGLITWRVPEIVAALPVILHIALLLFFTGLVLFLVPLDVAFPWVITAISAFAYIIYLILPLIPLKSPECPYKSPLTEGAAYLGHTVLQNKFMSVILDLTRRLTWPLQVLCRLLWWCRDALRTIGKWMVYMLSHMTLTSLNAPLRLLERWNELRERLLGWIEYRLEIWIQSWLERLRGEEDLVQTLSIHMQEQIKALWKQQDTDDGQECEVQQMEGLEEQKGRTIKVNLPVRIRESRRERCEKREKRQKRQQRRRQVADRAKSDRQDMEERRKRKLDLLMPWSFQQLLKEQQERQRLMWQLWLEWLPEDLDLALKCENELWDWSRKPWMGPCLWLLIRFWKILDASIGEWSFKYEYSFRSLKDRESEVVHQKETASDLLLSALAYLRATFFEPSVQSIALEAYSGLVVDSDVIGTKVFSDLKLVASIEKRFNSTHRIDDLDESIEYLEGSIGKTERLARCLLRCPGQSSYFDSIKRLGRLEPAFAPLALVALRHRDDEWLVNFCFKDDPKLELPYPLPPWIIKSLIGYTSYRERQKQSVIDYWSWLTTVSSSAVSRRTKVVASLLHELLCPDSECPGKLKGAEEDSVVTPATLPFEDLTIHALIGVLTQIEWARRYDMREMVHALSSLRELPSDGLRDVLSSKIRAKPIFKLRILNDDAEYLSLSLHVHRLSEHHLSHSATLARVIEHLGQGFLSNTLSHAFWALLERNYYRSTSGFHPPRCGTPSLS